MVRHYTVSAVILRQVAYCSLNIASPGCSFRPGGHIDTGEEPIQALHREAREEVGIEILAEERFSHPFRSTTLPASTAYSSGWVSVHFGGPR